MTNKPNILVVQADQLTALCLSSYGKPLAKTSSIDKIATNDTIFANTYCNSPVCGPSRASLMTGRLPLNVGVYDNAGTVPASFYHLSRYLRIILRVLGYQTTLCGKIHFVGPGPVEWF